MLPVHTQQPFNPIPDNERFARQYRYELQQSFQAAFTIFQVITLSFSFKTFSRSRNIYIYIYIYVFIYIYSYVCDLP